MDKHPNKIIHHHDWWSLYCVPVAKGKGKPVQYNSNNVIVNSLLLMYLKMSISNS